MPPQSHLELSPRLGRERLVLLSLAHDNGISPSELARRAGLRPRLLLDSERQLTRHEIIAVIAVMCKAGLDWSADEISLFLEKGDRDPLSEAELGYIRAVIGDFRMPNSRPMIGRPSWGQVGIGVMFITAFYLKEDPTPAWLVSVLVLASIAIMALGLRSGPDSE